MSICSQDLAHNLIRVSTSELFGSVSACDVPIVCTAKSKATIKRHGTTHTKEAH